MLNEAVGDLLPSALAVALSPVPIVAVVLILGSPRAGAAGPAFAFGWIAGLLAVSVAVLLLVGGGSDPDHDDPGLAWMQIAIGLLFLVMAAKQWAKRPRPGERVETPGWMARIDSATPSRAVLLGAALSAANPKNLALTLTAAVSIAEAGLDAADTAVATAAFIAIGSVTVVGAVLSHLLAGSHAEPALAAVKRFMSDNSAAIMMVVLLLLGAKLLGDGVAGL